MKTITGSNTENHRLQELNALRDKRNAIISNSGLADAFLLKKVKRTIDSGSEQDQQTVIF